MQREGGEECRGKGWELVRARQQICRPGCGAADKGGVAEIDEGTCGRDGLKG